MKCLRISASQSKTEEVRPMFSRSVWRNQLAWQHELARIRHRVFCFVHRGTKIGKKVRTQLRKAARRHERRVLKSDPTRKPALGFHSLVRLYYFWQRNGRTVDSVCPRHATGTPLVPQEFLLDFVRYCSAPRPLSSRATWNSFVATLPTPPPVTYTTITRYFPSATHRKIQREWRKVTAAQAAAQCLQDEAGDVIRAFYPAKGGRA